jgi:hypothetical protein
MHRSQPFCLFFFFKCIVFSEGVQRRLRFCLDHPNYLKMAAFQFYLQSGKQRKVGGMIVMLYFGQKFPGEK